MKRKCKYCGSFYPSTQEELLHMYRTLEHDIKLSPKIKNWSDKVKGIIVPHAGYMYSGKALYSACSLIGKRRDTIPETPTYVIIGPSHNVLLTHAVLPVSAKWTTPLGTIHMNNTIVNILKKQDTVFHVNEHAHSVEHSIEVILPMLQLVSRRKFLIVPILTPNNSVDQKYYTRLLNELSAVVVHNNTYIVISSDLSHYLPHKEAVSLDLATINSITALDSSKISDAHACGAYGIRILIDLVKLKGGKIENIMYYNSGDVTHDYMHVVGYGSFVWLSN